MATKSETLLCEGKTKKIFLIGNSGDVRVVSKNTATAGDGERRAEIPNKGKYSTDVACACFELLKAHGIPNHFVERMGKDAFRAHRLHMIPLECVSRRRATGSYPARYPEVPRGTIFSEPVIEFFYKDDKRHDPLVVHSFARGKAFMDLYNVKVPFASGKAFIESLHIAESLERVRRMVETITDLTRRTFLVIEEAWAAQDVVLVDLKIECGYWASSSDIEIVVGDVVTNDEWRIWPGGARSRDLSKQVLRDMAKVTPEGIRLLERNYALVAEMTKNFSAGRLAATKPMEAHR